MFLLHEIFYKRFINTITTLHLQVREKTPERVKNKNRHIISENNSHSTNNSSGSSQDSQGRDIKLKSTLPDLLSNNHNSNGNDNSTGVNNLENNDSANPDHESVSNFNKNAGILLMFSKFKFFLFNFSMPLQQNDVKKQGRSFFGFGNKNNNNSSINTSNNDSIISDLSQTPSQPASRKNSKVHKLTVENHFIYS